LIVTAGIGVFIFWLVPDIDQLANISVRIADSSTLFRTTANDHYVNRAVPSGSGATGITIQPATSVDDLRL
jgi:hypothetical protein